MTGQSPLARVAAAAASARPVQTTATATATASAALGVRYLSVPSVWGGATPAGRDCVGFVHHVVEQVTGQAMPRTTRTQIGFGTAVTAGDIRAGDLVFFANTCAAGITHLGIALGHGRFVHAGGPGTGTILTSLSAAYYARRFTGARRPCTGISTVDPDEEDR